MNYFKELLVLFSLLLTPIISYSCTGGTNSGTLTPTAGYQTQAVSNGQYYVVNVVCGNTYNFSFCGNGGSAAWDTQLTILDNTGTTELATNDDFCSLQSDLTWTANFTGSIQILVSQYFCDNSGGSNATLAYNMTAGSSSAAFMLTGVCQGITANITGDTGGTFSWNPSNPGDGSSLDTSTGTISSGVQGTTYTLDYTNPCGVTATQSATVPSGDCWTLNGDATYINIGGEQCIQLTAEINNQTACAWNGSQVDFSTPFTLSLEYYFGNNINGADGNTFTFQPSSSTACGTNGGQLGAGGLANALTIEFDTYDNDNPTHLYDMSCDHIAVEIDGNMQGPGAPLCGPVCAKAGGGNIDDGGTYDVDITWNPTTQQLEIYFDGALRLSCSHDFITNVFGTNSVYWGVTSATGGLNNQQYFCPSTVVLPTELQSFTSSCQDEYELVNWRTVSEIDVSRFVLESTTDGILYEPIKTIDAVGNSQELQEYEVRIELDNKTSNRLYRLKMIDNNGEYEYSGLILSKKCNVESIISNVSTVEGGLVIQLNESASCTLRNSLGQVVYQNNLEEEHVFISTDDFSNGVYLFHATGPKGNSEVQKLFIH